MQLVVFAPELFFEERMENHGGGAGVLHALDVVDVLRERRGGGNKRRSKLNPEVGGGEFHDVGFDGLKFRAARYS